MAVHVKVICDSISAAGVRITTLQLRYPRFIHSEFMTHRVFSRNASSSRAIPVQRLIQDILDDTAMPIHWGKNQKGMQANVECDNAVCLYYPRIETREKAWLYARDEAIMVAQSFDKAGYHKQIVNRLLEPFSHINVLVTSTKWANFFALRDHKDAQPEIRILAQEMKRALEESKPKLLKYGEWHLPYCPDGQGKSIGVSVARCARVSYLTQDGREPSMEEDLKLYDRLVGSVPLHASPCEHQATPDRKNNNQIDGFGWMHPQLHGNFEGWMHPQLHGNFEGWIQYRKTLENEYVKD